MEPTFGRIWELKVFEFESIAGNNFLKTWNLHLKVLNLKVFDFGSIWIFRSIAGNNFLKHGTYISSYGNSSAHQHSLKTNTLWLGLDSRPTKVVEQTCCSQLMFKDQPVLKKGICIVLMAFLGKFCERWLRTFSIVFLPFPPPHCDERNNMNFLPFSRFVLNFSIPISHIFFQKTLVVNFDMMPPPGKVILFEREKSPLKKFLYPANYF